MCEITMSISSSTGGYLKCFYIVNNFKVFTFSFLAQCNQAEIERFSVIHRLSDFSI